MFGYFVVGREGATHFSLTLNGGKAAADRPHLIDAIGQRSTQIQGLDVRDIAEVTGIVVIRHLDAEAVVGGGCQPQSPLLIERHYQISVRDPGIASNIVGCCVQIDWAHGGRHSGGPLYVDVGADIDETTRESHCIETGHGGRIAGEHAGVVSDGCLAGEGAAHAGSGLFGQLETCSLGLA